MSRKFNRTNRKDNLKNDEKKRDLMSVIAIIISICSLVVSVYSCYIISSEYEYKIDPKLDVKQALRLKRLETGEATPNVTNPKIEILQENNIDKIFIVDVENNVKKLPEEEYENGEFSLDINGREDKPIPYGKNVYKYKFIIVESLDDSMDIYTYYTKTSTFGKGEVGKVSALLVEPAEIYMWDNFPDNDEEYKGEKHIAKEYKKLVKWLKENRIN